VEHGLLIKDEKSAKHEIVSLGSRSLFQVENAEGLAVAVSIEISVGVVEEDGFAVGGEKLLLYFPACRADGLRKGRRVLQKKTSAERLLPVFQV
jgi:hypothetical protein